jgi:hypothetical protein
MTAPPTQSLVAGGERFVPHRCSHRHRRVLAAAAPNSFR